MDDLQGIPDDWDLDAHFVILDDNIVKTNDLDHIPNPAGIGVEIFTSMSLAKSNVAQISADTEADDDTYDNLLSRCVRTAMEMTARGVTTKDFVVVCSYNHLNSCVPYIATLFICAKIAAMDPSIPQEDIKHLVSLVKPKMLFIVPECKDKYEQICKDLQLNCEIIIFDETGENSSFKQFLVAKTGEDDFNPTPAESIEDTAMVFFSSGSSGMQKGICLNHYTVLCQAANFLATGCPSSVTLCYASLYWLSSIPIMFQAIWSGNARVLCNGFVPELTWKYIEKYGVTMLILSPFQIIKMLKSGKPENLNISSLGYIAIIGSGIASKYIEDLRNVFPHASISPIYGLAKCGGPVTMFKPSIPNDMTLMKQKPSSCGRPMWGHWYKICSMDSHEPLGPNEHGELRVKTKYQLNSYIGVASDGVWDDEGWLLTGDVCYYDDDFCFYFVDRTEDVIKYQSWHVTPSPIEAVLLQHEHVDEAIVLGVPNSEDGEHPMAVVLLAPEAHGVTEDEIQQFVNSQVDEKQQLRGGVRFVDSFPHTPSATINRNLAKKNILLEMGHAK